MSTVVYLITGANRPDGLGFHAIKALLENPQAHVVVSARDPEAAVELKELGNTSGGRVSVVKMDVGDFESVKASFDEVAGITVVRDHGIDVLFANSGVSVNPNVPASKIDAKDLQESFQVNTFGAIYVSQVFLPLLRLGTQKKIVYTSSALGSTTLAIDFFVAGGFASYGMSKAATNHYFKRLHNELSASEGFTVIVYHPGLIETSLSGAKAGSGPGGITVLTAEQGGRLAANLLTTQNVKDSGKFLNETGDELPY